MILLRPAERMGRQATFRRFANDTGCQPVSWDVGGCSNGFENFASILAPLAVENTVGSRRWRALPSTRNPGGAGRGHTGRSDDHSVVPIKVVLVVEMPPRMVRLMTFMDGASDNHQANRPAKAVTE
jgi:hypothetical protein